MVRKGKDVFVFGLVFVFDQILFSVGEPRLGQVTDNFWTVSAPFSASQSSKTSNYSSKNYSF